MSRQKRRISEALSPGGKRARNGDPDFSRSLFDSLEYSNGSICEIYLKNFMTHQEYHWRPGAFVNLISGPNGAGKSSILQAIVIALGGRASDTKRTAKLAENIKHGAQKATVRVHLFNGRQDDKCCDQYRYEKYGDQIIFERNITTPATPGAQAPAPLTIKGSSGYTFNGKATEEKQRIHEHFHIELNNPLLILQQEEAKNFFSRQDDKTMYDFFESGSLLRDLQVSNKTAKTEIDDFQKSQHKDKEKRELLVTEIKKLEEYQELFINESQNKSENNKLLLWANLNNTYKPKREAAKKALELNQRQINELNAKLAGYRAKSSEERQKVERGEFKLATTRDKEDTEKKEKKKLEDESKVKSSQLTELEKRLASIRDEKANSLNTIQELKNDILQQKMDQNQNKNAHQGFNSVASKEQLEQEEEFLKERESKIRLEINAKGEARDSLSAQISECESQHNRIDKAIKSKEEALQSFLDEVESSKKQSNKELARFGHTMVKFVNEIERQSKRFVKGVPVGPLARFVKLTPEAAKNDDLSSLIHSQIGMNLLRAFIVYSQQDYKILDGIARKIFHAGKTPLIIIKQRKESGRYDINKNRVSSSSSYTVMLDYLTFTHDEVFNTLIDQINCEQIIVTDDKTAQDLFKDRRKVPQNAKLAITLGFFKYFPASLQNNYGSYYLNKNRNVLNLLIPDKDLDRQIQSSESSFKDEIAKLVKDQKETNELKNRHEKLKTDLKQEIATLNEDLKEIRTRTMQIKTQLQQWSTNKQDVQRIEQLIEENSKKLERLSKEETDKIQKANDLKKRLAEIRDTMSKIETTLKELSKDIVIEENNMKEPQRLLASLENTISDKLSERNNLEKKEPELKRALEENDEICKKKEQEALKASNGKELIVDWNTNDTKAIRLQQDKRKGELQQELGTDFNKVKRDLEKKLAELEQINVMIEEHQSNLEQLAESNMKRWQKYEFIREHICSEIKRTFKVKMLGQGLCAKIKISIERQELKIAVNPEGDTDKYVQLSSLSGGERSKTLVFLIHSLWDSMASPFRGLDEWDVFLDDKSRKAVERDLVEHSKKCDKQFFFISPQNSCYSTAEEIEKNGDLVKVLDLKKND